MPKNDRYNVEETPGRLPPDAAHQIFQQPGVNIVKPRVQDRTRFGAFKITHKGMEIGEGAQEKDWREAGEFIFQVESGIQWLIGDWLAYGEAVDWGHTDEIASNLGREPQTLYNYTTVAKAIEFSRRRENVSFSHHSEVMGMPIEKQEVALSYVAAHRMSQKDFRRWIRLGMPEEGLPEETAPALPPESKPENGFISLYREIDKLRSIDPSKLKPRDREAARSTIQEYIRQVNQFTREAELLRQRWGIDE